MKPIFRYKEKMQPFTKFLRLAYLTCSTLLLLSSCKKESPDFPYAEIINFSITDANGAPLKGVINNDEIIIYWPPEQQIPETVTPLITVSERANVQPASNTPVTFIDGTSFMVTAQDGTKKTYQLKRIVNVPKPYITSFNGITSYNDKDFVLVGEQLSFNGDYFNMNDDQLKVFLVAADGSKVQIRTDSMISPINIRAIIDETALGSYTTIRLESTPHIINVEREFEVIEDPRPIFTEFSAPLVLKRGQEYKLVGKNLDKVEELQLNNENSNDFIPVEIVNVSSNEVTIKIPLEFPLNTYQAMGFSYEPNSYFSDTFGATYLPNPITITE